MNTLNSSRSYSTDLTDAELENLYYTYNPVAWAQDHICTIGAFNLPNVLDNWQIQFLSDNERNILLTCHRQAGKSTMVSIKALHRAIFRDGKTILLVSPTQRQSSELFHRVRTMIRNTKYASMLTTDNVTSLELTNGSRIISLPGMDWNIRGYTADMVIVDEAAQVDDSVFDAISPMLLITKGALILLSTPKGDTGYFYRAYQSDVWKKYIVSVNDNPRMQTEENKMALQKELKLLGSRIYSQEYECAFLNAMDVGRIKRSWIRFYDITTLPDIMSQSSDRYTSWDPASKVKEINDYTAGTVWMRIGNEHYLLDLFYEKVTFPDQVRALLNMDERYNPVYNINEDKSNGIAINQEMRERYPNVPMYEFNPGRMDKAQRLDIAAPFFEEGHVYFPAHVVRDADKLIYIPTEESKAIIDNLASFPEVEHDDLVDSVSQYFVFTHNNVGEQNVYFF